MEPNTLLISIVAARGLVLKGHAKIDAVTTITVHGKGGLRSRVVSDVIQCDGDCRWDENCEFKVNEQSQRITANVSHKNRIGGTDLIGKVELSYDEARQPMLTKPTWFTLKKKPGDEKQRGEVCLKFAFSYVKPTLSISNQSLNTIQKDSSIVGKMKRKMAKLRPKRDGDGDSAISRFSMRSAHPDMMMARSSSTLPLPHPSAQPSLNPFDEPSGGGFQRRGSMMRRTGQHGLSASASHAALSPLGEPPLGRSTPLQSAYMNPLMSSVGPPSPSVSTAESFHRPPSVTSSGFGSNGKNVQAGQPDSQMTREDLLSLVDKLRVEVQVKDSRLRDVQEYLDALVARVMDKNPDLLAVPVGNKDKPGMRRGFFSLA